MYTYVVVMFRSSVLDRGPPGPRVFWEDRDRTKTDPQRPKDRWSFSVLKFANFWGFLGKLFVLLLPLGPKFILATFTAPPYDQG